MLALALYDRLRSDGPVLVRIGTLVGLLWSFALVASGLVFTYEMITIESLAASDRAQAVLVVGLTSAVPPLHDAVAVFGCCRSCGSCGSV